MNCSLSRVFVFMASLTFTTLMWGQTTPLPPAVPSSLTIDELSLPGGIPAGLAMDQAGDGRIFVGGILGNIHLVHAGATSLIGTVPEILAFAESGLLGLAVDPQWPAKPYLYVYYTTIRQAAVVNILSRFTVEGDLKARSHSTLALGRRIDLIEDVSAFTGIHNAGCLRFGPDDMLYLSTGDGGPGCRAQDLTNPHGKILRLDVRGLRADRIHLGDDVALNELDPGDNPFVGPNPITALIFCYGLRNPFRFSIDKTSGALTICDVGAASFEEVNRAHGGENFGWPVVEGVTPFANCGPDVGPPPYVDPLFIAPHSAPLSFNAMSSFGGLYRSDSSRIYDLGPDFDQTILFGDIGDIGPLARIVEQPSGTWTIAPPISGQTDPLFWATFPYLGDAFFGDDGAIYAMSYAFGQVLRIRPAGPAWSLTINQGDEQAGTAGRLAFEPLRVTLVDGLGQPVKGEEIIFSITRGNGETNEVVVTDQAGVAEASYTYSENLPMARCQVVAYHDRAPSVTFDVHWRGLDVAPLSSGHGVVDFLSINVVHSAPAEEVLIAFELGNVSAPFFEPPAGPVWTSLLSPSGAFGVLTGLGTQRGPLFTDSEGFLSTSVRIPPSMFGQSVTFQAYAFDTNQAFPANFFVSNPIQIDIP